MDSLVALKRELKTVRQQEDGFDFCRGFNCGIDTAIKFIDLMIDGYVESNERQEVYNGSGI